VNPQSVSAVYKRSLGNGSAFRTNGLFFIIDENAAAADSTMAGAQLGCEFAAIDTLKLDFCEMQLARAWPGSGHAA
jgi:hypothetical protein